MSRSTYAYFEVLSARGSDIVEIELFAEDSEGRILDRGSNHRHEGFKQGIYFEVFLSDAPADKIARWRIQAKRRDGGTIMGTCDAMTRSQRAEPSMRVDYVHPPSPVVEKARTLGKLKGNYQGVVVFSYRGNYFHHPDCRTVRAMRPENRREYATPQEAYDSGLFPCFECLWIP